MDVSSVFKSEVLRPVTTLVVPGSLAIAPYIEVSAEYAPAIRRFWDAHPAAFVAVVTILVLAAGLILEDLGALIETQLWDRIQSKKDSTFRATWESYLGLKLKDEMVGQRYLRGIVGRLKFELSMAPALLSFAIGIAWMNKIQEFWSPTAGGGAFVFVVIVATYLLWESYQSATLLAQTRKQIVKAENGAG